MRQFSAVLQGAFRFAVIPKRFITFNPMQYVKLRGRKDDSDIFSEDESDAVSTATISYEQYEKLTDWLKGKENLALLPVQIAYYTGLRLGEVCGLTWQDINLDEQYLTVRRSMRYNGTRHKIEIGTERPSATKSAQWTSATPWRRSFERQSWNSTRTVSSTVSFTS